MNIFIPKIIVKETAYTKLLKHIYDTDFQYETGGILLGYSCLQIFYVTAFTFPRHSKNATKMTFILNGEEHMEEMEKVRKKFRFPPKLIGVWHSHTTDDSSLSFQDKESNEVLVSQFGEILSFIITQKGVDGIQLTAYYISRKRTIHLCKCKYNK
ncbi:MAG: hypothetical protein HDR14_10690 [Lachnospiraceae bacterium]|nr:hypothetical protein [Lachnospiraceae bacterium]